MLDGQSRQYRKALWKFAELFCRNSASLSRKKQKFRPIWRSNRLSSRNMHSCSSYKCLKALSVLNGMHFGKKWTLGGGRCGKKYGKCHVRCGITELWQHKVFKTSVSATLKSNQPDNHSLLLVGSKIHRHHHNLSSQNFLQ